MGLADVNNNIYLSTSICEVLGCAEAGWSGPRREMEAVFSVQCCVAGKWDGTHAPIRDDGELGEPLRGKAGSCQAQLRRTALTRERRTAGD